MKDSVARVESAKPVKPKMENLKYGEDLMQALDAADDFKNKIEQYGMLLVDCQKDPKLEKPKKPELDVFVFGDKTIFDHVLYHIEVIPRAELESALKFLPYSYVERFLYYLEHFIRKV